ncbi:MAG: hypothetical protein E7167_01370 [Firmicutes bacterium]|nr:hypothetical protein [Bacillota bacterium]
MKTIKLVRAVGPFGDEMSKYDVIFPDMTIADFILIVVKENPSEWGKIKFNGEIVCEYSKGVITCLKAEINILKTTVTSKDAWARGGWSMMDYHLYGKALQKVYPEPQEQPNFLF